jgi:hypothetical protein
LLQQAENVNLKKACTGNPSPAASALNAIASNARCAALIGNAFEEKTLWQTETAVLSEHHLWHLYHTAVYKFKGLNAFADEPLQRCKDLFARAFYLHLTRHDQDLSTDDQELVTKYGILTDTAVAVVTPCLITKGCPPLRMAVLRSPRHPEGQRSVRHITGSCAAWRFMLRFPRCGGGWVWAQHSAAATACRHSILRIRPRSRC